MSYTKFYTLIDLKSMIFEKCFPNETRSQLHLGVETVFHKSQIKFIPFVTNHQFLPNIFE